MNDSDGRYALDCWLNPNPGEARPDRCLFSDNDSELGAMMAQASRFIADRQFHLVVLCERDLDGRWRDGWLRMVEFSQPMQLS